MRAPAAGASEGVREGEEGRCLERELEAEEGDREGSNKNRDRW